MRKLVRVPDWVVLVGFCVVFSLETLASVAYHSATFDEPSDLVSGYMELTRGQYWLKPETLPFAKVVAALPLLVLGVRTPPADDNPWTFYDRMLYEFNDGERLLMVARASVLTFSLLLGCLVFAWTRRLFGRAAALFALGLYAFEPNLVAHSALVTTDLAVACFFFLAVYGLFRLVEHASIGRLVVMSLALALAVVTKLSAGSLVFVLGLLALIAGVSTVEIPLWIAGRRVSTLAPRGRKLIGLAGMLLVAGLVAYGAIWATYRFDYSGLPAGGPPPAWKELAAEGTLGAHALGWLRHTRIFPEPYVYNFFYHLHVARWAPGFLLGQIRAGGWWYYFVVTLLVKTPVPLLALVGLALVVQAKRWRTTGLASAFLMIPAAVYFVFISASGFNLGHRHLLASVPFLLVSTGVLIPWAAERGVWVRGGLAVLACWYVASSLSIFPHYLAYFNEFAGGPGRGGRYLVDSNVDWGQDLKGLKRYMDRHGIERVWLSYFGTVNPEHYGIRYDPLPGSPPWWRPVRPDLLGLERLPRMSGTVAISVTHLQGVYLPLYGATRGYFERYRDIEPAAKIGYSIFVYRLEGGSNR